MTRAIERHASRPLTGGKNSTPDAAAAADITVLKRKWQAALRPGQTLPHYEDVMLGSLGRMADHIALLKADDDTFEVSRSGRYVQKWLGDERWDIPLDALPVDCATVLAEACTCVARTNQPHLMLAHSVRDGVVQSYDVLALPTASRWGGRLIGVYINERGTRYNLVDAIFSATDEGIVSLAAIRDTSGEVFDFQIVHLNQGALKLLEAQRAELLWLRLSAGGRHALCTPAVWDWLLDVITAVRGGSLQLEIERGDRCLRLSAMVSDDLVSLAISDVTDLKRREESFRLLFEGNPMPMWVFDVETKQFLSVNDAAISHYGYDRPQFLAMKLNQIWPRDEWDSHTRALGSIGAAYQSEHDWRHLKADGSEIHVMTFGRRVTFDNREGYLVAIVDITERRRAEARVVHMAHHDGLTELPNRVLYQERLNQALDAYGGAAGQVAVLCIDLDLFKNVNDSFGHPTGDRLLRLVAGRMRAAVGGGNIVARLGGDEFAIVLASDVSANDVSNYSTGLIKILSKPYDIDGMQIVIGASVGIALAPDDGRSSDELMRNADMALYRAKSEGGGVHRFFEPEMDRLAQKRRDLELDLRSAFTKGEFELHYQPLVSLTEDRIIGFEALLRWRHPAKGMISPAEFIPVAEDIGLISAIGEWVLNKACSDAAAWPHNIKLAVNLSPAQFRGRTLVPMVVAALRSSRLSPLRLELEITESLFLAETEVNLAILHELRALGIKISMDDFGTGYSSLSYLRSFPFDKIKIDRSFVRDLGASADCIAIVRAIAGIGRSLNITTTAEGVETVDQLERLRAEGCDEVQGFLFSAARPASEIGQLLADFGREATMTAA